ncbi:MAG TPA: YtxH domain-containing protein [Bacilli bacterium]
MFKMSGKGKSFLLGALLGGIAGSVAALLFAPKPGRELREDIAQQVQTVSGKTQDILQNVKEETLQFAARAKGSVVSAIDGWKAARKQASAGEPEQTAGDRQENSAG